ncbi:tripartite motif-containing protein 60-like [Pteronotus mesoamericanus]|uniref:tripartite motif-containing protein 60-like n=1 Tax=Pteronotus mesoamericanus TaxID=1884717 RepID=UPI0023EDB51A|nr:tripartite motif-containing protein 60-like [Pteronotus parnellii mesoamericanus]
MAFAASLVELQAEASCPICLDYLRDPVTIECGHNFCRSCIDQRWEGLQDIFPCPVCLHHCCERNFRRNTQLCHITDILKQIPTMRRKRKRQENPFCKEHHEVLTLFCEEDLELLCPQCGHSSDHGGHSLIPTEEAAASHRRKLRSYIEPLREQVEDAEKDFEMQISKDFELRWMMDNQRSALHYEVEQFKHFLESEQDEIHTRLFNEETCVQEKINEKKTQILNHSSILKSLLSEIIRKCLQTDLDLLTGIKSIHSVYENLETPAAFSCELKEETFTLLPQYFGLHKMISTFQVDLTLDPETAHHNLTISPDRKTAIFQMRKQNCVQNPKAFKFYPAVLSTEGFDAGRHFWQVEIGGKGEWSLGVCKESFSRNALLSPSPRNGCWQIQLWTSTFRPWDSVNPRRIGIFLDYELGEVSFYNLKNRSHLYTFNESLTEKLMPYFSIGPSSKSLTMRLVKDEC